MKCHRLIYLVVMIVTLVLFGAPAFSQEPQNQPPDAPAPKELALYGEVKDINAASSSLSVQYYDYDNDEEKTAEVVLNKDTKLENASALANIEKGDWVDVSYTIVDGKNVAKSVKVEKEEQEETPAGGAPAETSPDTESDY